MKRTFVIILMIYILVIGLLFYALGGYGLLSGFKALQWRGIEVRVPPDFKAREYSSKGWQVLSLARSSALIKIALKQDVNVFDLSGHEKRVVMEKQFHSPDPATLYVAKLEKRYMLVFAVYRDNTTLYISISNISLFLSRYVLDAMLESLRFNGSEIKPPRMELPLELYVYDLLILGSLLIPLVILIPLLYFSGKKPGVHHFEGESIMCEEMFVYTSFNKKWNRTNTFSYLVLTNARLMVFCFGKLKLEIKLDEEKPAIEFKGKKIILKRNDTTVILSPRDIDQWESCLSRFRY